MTSNSQPTITEFVSELYSTESRRVFASLVRLVKDFDLAEEALHEAFTTAVEQWETNGIPNNPRAWLVSTGRFKAIDLIRKRARWQRIQPGVSERLDSISETNATKADHDIEDDRLRLIFTCCHPAIDPKVQVPLTLREVCGLTTEEIANAFLTSPSTMAQRIVRGKAKIRDAGIPFSLPSLSELPDRLDSVLAVIYLVFNEGYSASMGSALTRTDLSNEAIRLARLMLELLPDPEVMGLLALMLLHESRRKARSTNGRHIVLLEDQDRSLWDQELITEGQQLVQRSIGTRRIGTYTLQAAISAVHAEAASASETDWSQIVALYDLLLRAEPSPIVELNRAVAIAMRDEPKAGLQLIDELIEKGALAQYHLAHAARGELLRRMGKKSAARASLKVALQLAQQEPERDLLRRRIAELG